MTDSPLTLTRDEALAILDPDGTGLVQVFASQATPSDAAGWRGVVKVASVEAPKASSSRRRVTWREVADAEAPSAEEAIARAVAVYQKGWFVHFNRAELAGVYEAAHRRSITKPESEREADAAEALARHVTAKTMADIARLGADVDRLRLALQALADAADVVLFDDVMWAGASVPPALLDRLDQAEQVARAALTMAARHPALEGGSP